MNGFWSSASRWFSEKTSSPLYFTYIGFFVVWNWKFFQIIFFESPVLFWRPRIEYLEHNLYFHTGAYQLAPVVDFVLNFVWHAIPPAIFTFVAIVYLPIIQKWALEKHLNDRFERKQMFTRKQREYDEWLLSQEKKKTATVKSIVVERQAQIEGKKEIEKSLSEQERWELEYQEFEKMPSLIKFQAIIRAVYRGDGWTEGVDPGAIALADTRDLITFTNDNRSRMELSQKGKTFAKLYLAKHPVI